MPTALPNRLAAVRQANTDLSQRKVGRLIGWRPAFANYIERGFMLPSVQELATICELFGCSPRDLYDDDLLAMMKEGTDVPVARTDSENRVPVKPRRAKRRA